jgi:hypothetical protein
MPGPTGILDGLNNDQQDQLLTWLELYPIKEVLEMVAAPPPEGFGIKTHITSLRRFQQQAQLNGKEDDLRMARRAQLTGEELDIMRRAASSALVQQAFHFTSSKTNDSKNIAAAAKWLALLHQQELRMRELALSEARLELERKRIELNLALRESKSRTQFQEEKIRAAREAFTCGNPKTP